MCDLARVRNPIDPEYAQPQDVESLARDVNMSAGHLSTNGTVKGWVWKRT